ncbi:MAG: methyl-accepting chemotaxis protein [Snowella sp.]|nr:methyl-accepting chemotaxis protein [Snowella sp.]
MTSSQDYAHLYGQAYVAYGQGSYEEAASYIQEMATAFPEDPNVLLLQGHIYVGLEQYETAQQKYQEVLRLSDRQDLRDCASQALDQIQSVQSGTPSSGFSSQGNPNSMGEATFGQSAFNYESQANLDKETDFPEWNDHEGGVDWDNDFDGLDWDSAVFNDEDLGEPTLGQTKPPTPTNPFGSTAGSNTGNFNNEVDAFSSNPFAFDDAAGLIDWNAEALAHDNVQLDDDDDKTLMPEVGESTFMVPPNLAAQQFDFADLVEQEISTPSQSNSANPGSVPTFQPWQGSNLENGIDSLDNVPTVQSSPSMSMDEADPDFLSSIEGFNKADLDHLAEFDLTDIAPELPDSTTMFTQGSEGFAENTAIRGRDSYNGESGTSTPSGTPPGMVTWLKPEDSLAGDLTGVSSRFVKPTVEVDPGWLGWFTNAPLRRKQWYLAIASGIASALAVFIVGSVTGMNAPQKVSSPPAANKTETPKAANNKAPQKPNAAAKPANKPQAANPTPSGPSLLVLALATGIVGFGVTWLISYLLIQQFKSTIDDLQNQFDAIYDGNFNVRAKVTSEDELGQLAQRFNYISQVILTATTEAQERAAATEKAREKLQRQVIRLLDDVEGASRGDLTVQAEVTADELGAVADAFNLTIQNLREIVQQVKRAAKQVNKNSTDSESFARNNSSDALRMAEELAVTLNSVQLMTESIQRVAENAHEAEEVAHTSSVTALKGGEAVERTVGGILQIRETVSETARKVKRLAEASQEISKIVAVISQIASRTNLLALNASIQAARAGEAGRGFAIVADEVRQLADRSAKSLKEIEQIVLQIQSETGSVMTAMEEGIQQVIDVTDKSEQSKRALEDIIEVSNRINTLVRSISGDTVKQQENSGAVAQVMQSIELTAQETSQESQRVAGSLQSLVSISKELLTSVERFRVDK